VKGAFKYLKASGYKILFIAIDLKSQLTCTSAVEFIH